MTMRIERKQTRTHDKKHTTQTEETPKKKAKKEDSKSKQCRHKRQVGPKEGCVPNTQTQNNKN